MNARLVCHMAVLSGKHRRNSLEAMRECFEAGAARIEIDVHSLDGPDYAVFHDARLDEQTTGTGAIGRATPGDVSRARWREGPAGGPPLLSEAVALARAFRTEIQLDLKDWRPLSADRLRALLDVIGPIRDRIIVSSGQDWNLMRLHRADPELAFGFDPGHYIDRGTEETPVFLPRTMGAYGYRDDHPLAAGRLQEPADYLRQRFELLTAQAAGSREYFLNYRLVLQMLDDGFNVAAFLHQRGVDANVWTPDYRDSKSVAMLRRLFDAGIVRVTTNTAPAWQRAFDTGDARDPA